MINIVYVYIHYPSVSTFHMSVYSGWLVTSLKQM